MIGKSPNWNWIKKQNGRKLKGEEKDRTKERLWKERSEFLSVFPMLPVIYKIESGNKILNEDGVGGTF